MDFISLIALLAVCVCLYLFFGLVIKFVWEWWMLGIAIPVSLLLILMFGLIGAILGILGFFVAVNMTNNWHSNPIYLKGSRAIDHLFGLGDL